MQMVMISFILSWFLISCKITNGFRKQPFPHFKSIKTGLNIQRTISATNENLEYDVTVLGGGPAGTTIAWLLQQQYKLKVALIDPRGDKDATWYPNYGEWQDEWHWLTNRLNIQEMKYCTTNEWEKTDCYFGGSGDISMNERTRLNRPYIRVDRVKLQKLLRSRFKEASGTIFKAKLRAKRVGPNLFDQNIVHTSKGSSITLDNDIIINSKLVIDSTGFESQLIAKEDPVLARGNKKRLKEGYQIAYGFIANCSGVGPYDFDAMTLFDYRTDHLDHDLEWKKDAENRPTFMYVMPLGKNPDGTMRVFWEETSLVGAGKRRLSFEECKKRAMQRLKYHNIEVFDIEEEEYCYIPMGGELPALDQRIVALGGSANMVHPSTGYHVCRMMAAAVDLAETITKYMQSVDNNKGTFKPDKLAALAYQSLWNPSNRLQRDFQAYGGDFLMQQNVHKLRGFFSAFFALNQPAWSGFLAGWPGLPNNQYHDSWDKRFTFALNLFVRMPPDVAVAMVLYAIRYTLEYGPNTLLRSLAPPFLLGEGPVPIDYDATYGTLESGRGVGDMEAKEEARRMMLAFAAEKPHLPERTEETHAGEVHETLKNPQPEYPSPYDGI